MSIGSSISIQTCSLQINFKIPIQRVTVLIFPRTNNENIFFFVGKNIFESIVFWRRQLKFLTGHAEPIQYFCRPLIDNGEYKIGVGVNTCTSDCINHVRISINFPPRGPVITIKCKIFDFHNVPI